MRKLPFGPPFNVQFQGSAELLDIEDPLIAEYAEQGRFSGIISKKDLQEPGLCFVRITPGRRVSTFGLGVPLLDVIREPLGAMRSIEW